MRLGGAAGPSRRTGCNWAWRDGRAEWLWHCTFPGNTNEIGPKMRTTMGGTGRSGHSVQSSWSRPNLLANAQAFMVDIVPLSYTRPTMKPKLGRQRDFCLSFALPSIAQRGQNRYLLAVDTAKSRLWSSSAIIFTGGLSVISTIWQLKFQAPKSSGEDLSAGGVHMSGSVSFSDIS